jgi:mannitol-1-phosphate 5-dehydrogenase
MVPVQTEEMQDGEPLRVCVEKYGFLPVDRAAFKGEVPEIKSMVPFSPFDYYIKRKLFLHNMGHAVCAYLGNLKGYKYISEAINDPEIYIVVQNAMLDSARALSKEYGVDLNEILPHVNDLLFRFANPELRDTCARVGADPVRKLGRADRLIGASLLQQKHGIMPVYTGVGAAGALMSYDEVNDVDSAKKALLEIAGLSEDHELSKLIVTLYNMFLTGGEIVDVRIVAEVERQADVEII